MSLPQQKSKRRNKLMEYIYGALLLHKLGQPVNEENLKKVIAASGVSVDETKVKILLASLEGVDIAAELENASAIAAAPAAAPAESKEEKKEEEKPAESAAGLSSLFG
jgi:large subunit ribosomal protein L12